MRSLFHLGHWPSTWVWVCLLLVGSDLRIFFIVKSGNQFAEVLCVPAFHPTGCLFPVFIFLLLAFWVFTSFFFFFCPFLYSSLFLPWCLLANKCGRDWKREPESPEKQSLLHTNVLNTNVRGRKNIFAFEISPLKNRREKNKHKYSHLCSWIF